MALSRRVLLKHGTALAVLVPLVPCLAASTDNRESKDDIVGFAGDSTVHLTVLDTVFKLAEPVAVSAADRVRWSPDAENAFGSTGKLNGQSGFFSGNKNLTEPQLFMAWPEVVPDSRLSGFRQKRNASSKQALADHPDNWTISVGGEPAKIVALYRRSSPIGTWAVGVRRWESSKRHYLTFNLDRTIPDGATITIEGPSFSKSEYRRNSQVFSEAIHVCQAGYPVVGAKIGYVGSWWGHDNNGQSANTDFLLSENTGWQLISAEDGSVKKSGLLALAKPVTEAHQNDANFNGCDIYEADFSDLELAGRYHLQIEGLGRSFPFEVSAQPYENALRLAARWYFHQRSGCEIAEPHGEGRIRPRNGHPDDGLTVWQTQVTIGQTIEGYAKADAFKLLSEYAATHPVNSSTEQSGMTANPAAWGGWHDAGDWDRRIQHMDVVFHMADIIETFEHTRSISLNLPESKKPFADPAVAARKNDQDLGDGKTVLPDLIHEALWGASLWRRTQGDDGSIIGGVEYSSSGIVGSVSWNPVQTTYAYGAEDWAAYRFAFGAAKLGHVIKTVCGDAVLGDAIVDEAVRAWHWAESQQVPVQQYTDNSRDSVLRARVASAAVVFRASGDEAARVLFENNNPFAPQSDDPIKAIVPERYPNSYLEYVRASLEGRPSNPKIVAAIKGWIKYRAFQLKRMGRDFGLHTTEAYPWSRAWMRFGPGSNWRASQWMMYYAANGELPAELRNSAIEGMWFGLGCNPANVSFVQGLGSRDFADPLMTERYAAATIPGQISFGVTGGKMHEWELRKIGGSIYPPNQEDWPIYAQIFESRSVVISAEHGIKSNALEWLIACAVATS
ncbi:glycoside hydrolase family 9 protein [Ruegeria arenilitoris]|uniref:glycoside hydrolase family 9 protein n=1 Tax=Ruegeria arenilitoris TaxID=1173585 RepID=UPI001481AC6F|nr:glycoside hydrolase family 9 protein [Ruegeria arenilitoris]